MSEISAVKDSLSNSFAMMSTRQKRRNKKLRRQTGTIDISYATDYYPEPIVTSSSALSELSEPETGLDRMRDFDDDVDDLSETISGATRTGSIETVDRLSVLSDSVPELLDADSLSEISLGLAKEPASSADDSACVAAPSGSTDGGWRVIPIQIIPCTEIVIERCEQQVCSTASASNSPKNDILNTSGNSVVSEKRKSVSPAVHPEADTIEVVGSVGCDDVNDTPVVAAVEYITSASVPATPMSDDRKRNKKSKLSMTSPATSLLEKSASWLSSLSGSKMGSAGGGKDKKMSKSRRTTKKSLTSLFEAVASSNNNNNTSSSNSRSKHTKM